MKNDLHCRIFEKLNELGIKIPFPQREVTLKNNTSKVEK